LWGLGLPLGILAWTGFVFMAWRMLKGEWKKHILLWGWTAAYFAWQSIQWNSTLRYQLPIYPLLAIIAAWFVFGIYERGKQPLDSTARTTANRVWRWVGLGIGALVLLASAIWAYAFMGIYPAEHTRISAARWLIQEMPGPITLPIEQVDGSFNQPLPFEEGAIIRAGLPYARGFTPHVSGQLSRIHLPHVVDKKALSDPTVFSVEISSAAGEGTAIASGQEDIAHKVGLNESELYILLDESAPISAAQTYYLTIDVNDGDTDLEVCSPVKLLFQPGQEGEPNQIDLQQICIGRDQFPLILSYTAQVDSSLMGIAFTFTEFREP
jgi:hypothetical protein